MKKTQIFNSNNKSLDLVNLKKLSSLPVELHSILIGIMLGDGGIYRSSPTANARFEMSLGTKYQKFAEYLGELFKEYMSNPVKSINIKGKTNNYTNYRFKTVSLPVFNQYHDMFYIFYTDKKNYIKIVPSNINELINPIVLAYLIMTDGNFDASRNRVRIYTNSYKKDEVVKLADAIMNNLKIYTGVLHDRNDQWILTIGAKNLELLRNTVSPHFHSSMLYRIGILEKTSAPFIFIIIFWARAPYSFLILAFNVIS